MRGVCFFPGRRGVFRETGNLGAQTGKRREVWRRARVFLERRESTEPALGFSGIGSLRAPRPGTEQPLPAGFGQGCSCRILKDLESRYSLNYNLCGRREVDRLRSSFYSSFTRICRFCFMYLGRLLASHTLKF